MTTWITHNEPWVVSFLGHAQGRFAPGVRDWRTAVAVSHHVLLSHGLAAPALPGRVGITCNLSPVSAVGPGDEEAARLYDGYLNRWFAKRVGLVHVDYETQRRTLKRSGAWYRDLIARTRDARRLG